MNLKTSGPKGHWVTHLRKRSKVTVEPFTEDHKCCPLNISREPLDDVIHQIKSSGPCSFRQEDF